VVSSAVEHCLHTAGVTGSIPVPPTSIQPKSLETHPALVWPTVPAGSELLLTQHKKALQPRGFFSPIFSGSTAHPIGSASCSRSSHHGRSVGYQSGTAARSHEVAYRLSATGTHRLTADSAYSLSVIYQTIHSSIRLVTAHCAARGLEANGPYRPERLANVVEAERLCLADSARDLASYPAQS
jgi:hypothetical protein